MEERGRRHVQYVKTGDGSEDITSSKSGLGLGLEDWKTGEGEMRSECYCWMSAGAWPSLCGLMTVFVVVFGPGCRV
jgi:hypothetical protein